ncbi:MAG: DUF2203 domain-containing protein [Mariniblastus sp.]|nr:DUF2203 domain-containing protein [Mariniblastus sp.]
MVRAIQNSDEQLPSNVGEPFTVDTANAMLPLVKRIVADMLRLQKTVQRQRERLSVIDQLQDTTDQPEYQEELADIRGSMQGEEQQLEACVRELNALGVEPQMPFDGSVDFPAVLNRRAVCLCWHPDDAGVEYWHEMGEPTSARQKLDTNIHPLSDR